MEAATKKRAAQAAASTEVAAGAAQHVQLALIASDWPSAPLLEIARYHHTSRAGPPAQDRGHSHLEDGTVQPLLVTPRVRRPASWRSSRAGMRRSWLRALPAASGAPEAGSSPGHRAAQLGHHATAAPRRPTGARVGAKRVELLPSITELHQAGEARRLQSSWLRGAALEAWHRDGPHRSLSHPEGGLHCSLVCGAKSLQRPRFPAAAPTVLERCVEQRTQAPLLRTAAGAQEAKSHSGHRTTRQPMDKHSQWDHVGQLERAGWCRSTVAEVSAAVSCGARAAVSRSVVQLPCGHPRNALSGTATRHPTQPDQARQGCWDPVCGVGRSTIPSGQAQGLHRASMACGDVAAPVAHLPETVT